MSETLESFEVRAEAVLSRAFRGIHHCGRITKTRDQWATNHHGDLSTYDHDILTRLVLAAHDYCIRVSVKNSGPGMIKVVLHPRIVRGSTQEDGHFYDRHPTIEQAITIYNKGR